MKKITVNELLAHYAQNFSEMIEKAFKQKENINDRIVAVMDELYKQLATPQTGGGFKVSCEPLEGVVEDIFDGATEDDWHGPLYEGDRDFTSMNMNTIDNARKMFLEILGLQVLSNPPKDEAQALAHVKRNIYSLFNQSNQFAVKYVLTYVDYDIHNGEYAESLDLTDYLLV